MYNKVADLSPIHFRKQSARDGFSGDLNIGEARVWRLDSGTMESETYPFDKAAIFFVDVFSIFPKVGSL